MRTRTKTSKSKVKRPKRAATEAAIVAAFDRLVRRDGLRNVGVNALVKEAGVGKGLIYQYFGGLSGVVKVWGENNKLWPSTLELMGQSDETFSGLSPREQIKKVILNHLEGLRRSPIGVEVLADELLAPTEITDVLRDARRKLGREHQALYAQNHVMREYDNRSLVMILLAAANYIAMRAIRAPHYMGEPVDTPEAWGAMLKRFERVVDMMFKDDGEPAVQHALDFVARS